MNTITIVIVTAILIIGGLLSLVNSIMLADIYRGTPTKKFIIVTSLAIVGVSAICGGLIEVMNINSDKTYKLIGEYDLIEIEDNSNKYVVNGIAINKKITISSDSIQPEYANTDVPYYLLSYLDDNNKEITLNLKNYNNITFRIQNDIVPRIAVSKTTNYDKKYLGLINKKVPKDHIYKYKIYLPN